MTRVPPSKRPAPDAASGAGPFLAGKHKVLMTSRLRSACFLLEIGPKGSEQDSHVGILNSPAVRFHSRPGNSANRTRPPSGIVMYGVLVPHSNLRSSPNATALSDYDCPMEIAATFRNGVGKKQLPRWVVVAARPWEGPLVADGWKQFGGSRGVTPELALHLTFHDPSCAANPAGAF